VCVGCRTGSGLSALVSNSREIVLGSELEEEDDGLRSKSAEGVETSLSVAKCSNTLKDRLTTLVRSVSSLSITIEPER